jgi:hypothetical protein
VKSGRDRQKNGLIIIYDTGHIGSLFSLKRKSDVDVRQCAFFREAYGSLYENKFCRYNIKSPAVAIVPCRRRFA